MPETEIIAAINQHNERLSTLAHEVHALGVAHAKKERDDAVRDGDRRRWSIIYAAVCLSVLVVAAVLFGASRAEEARVARELCRVENQTRLEAYERVVTVFGVIKERVGDDTVSVIVDDVLANYPLPEQRVC